MTSPELRRAPGLFRWRSYTPLAVLGPILLATAIEPLPFGGAGWAVVWATAGVALGVLGLLVRALVIGYAPAGTSGRATRVLRADALTTDGLYSLVRHPMYSGNGLLWMGVAVFAGRPLLVGLTAVAFVLVHRSITASEDRFLRERFGVDYERWAERTPAFVPRSLRWIEPARPFRFRIVLGRDYHALAAFVAATSSVWVVRSWSEAGGLAPTPWVWGYLAGGLTIFAVLHILKRRTSLLDPV